MWRRQPLASALAVIAALAAVGATCATPAAASTTQVSIIEPGGHLISDPGDTLHTLRLLGVSMIRLNMSWAAVAPDPTGHKPPHGFQASNPAAYPASQWAPYDAIIRDAAAAGIRIDLDLAGKAPQWAMPGYPRLTMQGSVRPSPSDYQGFVEAVGKRYDGTYTPSGALTPLPAITFWGIWNEPNYQSSLQPIGSGPNNSIPTSPGIYRSLVAAAWNGLHATGHGHDKMIIGELAARGYPNNLNGGMWPIVFVRSLYCVDSHYHQLQGTAARQQSCPTTAGASRRFRSQNPALFGASGFSVHPYSRWYAPNKELYTTCRTGLCASLANIGNLTTALNASQRAYGSHTKFPIYSTEYGYQTSPPKPSYDKKDKAYNVSTTTAAEYLNWAEYISYKNPQIVSYDQYELFDPVKPTAANDYGYSSGLLTWDGHEKATYAAFRLPLYLPKTSAASGHSLEVWGAARPAPFASLDTGGATQTADIQFEPKGSNTFTTIDSVAITNRSGYFDTHVVFPGSGTVRLTYTYPMADVLLAPGFQLFSRHVSVTVA
jgi:hypothetical protein